LLLECSPDPLAPWLDNSFFANYLQSTGNERIN
jgi:hypothetical protein